MPATFYSRRGKRALDAVIALLGLVALSPLFLLVSVLVALTSKGPVFFRQVRVGKSGRQFRIFKFRTMVWAPSAQGSFVTAAGDPRITAIGKALRKAKIDELPQLINVLIGEMSLVGPRPEMPQYAALYNELQRQVLSVSPGITSPASLCFSKEEELLAQHEDPERYYRLLLLPAKLSLDLEYTRNVRLLNDIKLILRTIATVLNFSKDFHKPLSRLNESS